MTIEPKRFLGACCGLVATLLALAYVRAYASALLIVPIGSSGGTEAVRIEHEVAYYSQARPLNEWMGKHQTLCIWFFAPVHYVDCKLRPSVWYAER